MARKKIIMYITYISIFIIFICIYTVYFKTESSTDKDTKIYNFYNKYHYGDNIFNLKFFYNISNYLKNNNIIINYYYEPEHIKNVDELERYVDNDTLKLFPFSERPKNSIIIGNGSGDIEQPAYKSDNSVPVLYHLWMGDTINNISHYNLDDYFPLFYSNILKILKLENYHIDTSIYQKEDYLLDVYKRLDPKFKDIDILIINAAPKSGQFDYNVEKMNNMCIRLASKYKVVVTSHVNDIITCTMTAGLKMQDIGAISTRAKYIISVMTGPVTPCFNSFTRANVRLWIMLCRLQRCYFKHINNVIIDNPERLGEIDSYIKI